MAGEPGPRALPVIVRTGSALRDFIEVEPIGVDYRRVPIPQRGSGNPSKGDGTHGGKVVFKPAGPRSGSGSRPTITQT